MEYNDETPRENFTVAGHVLNIVQPYTEGHTVTAGEAQALNQILAENVRNNLAKKIKEMDEADAYDEDAAQLLVDEYVDEYEMGVRGGGGGGRTVDPVRKEAMAITVPLVKDAVKKKHGSLKGVKIKDINAKAASIIDNHEHPRHAEIWARAKERVEAQREIADLELGDVA